MQFPAVEWFSARWTYFGLHMISSLLCVPGRFDIWDIFSNKAAGSVELVTMYQPSQLEVPFQKAEALAATAMALSTAAAAESKHDPEEQELLSKLRGLSQQEDTAELPAGALHLCLPSVKHAVLLPAAIHPSPVTTTADWGHEHCAKQGQCALLW